MWSDWPNQEGCVEDDDVDEAGASKKHLPFALACFSLLLMLRIIDPIPYTLEHETGNKPHCKKMGAKGSKASDVAIVGEQPKLGKSGKKICCSCPETKKVSYIGTRHTCQWLALG